jgi:hypothetical protein
MRWERPDLPRIDYSRGVFGTWRRVWMFTFQYLESKRDFTYIGSEAVILPRIKVGDDSVIGAGRWCPAMSATTS